MNRCEAPTGATQPRDSCEAGTPSSSRRSPSGPSAPLACLRKRGMARTLAEGVERPDHLLPAFRELVAHLDDLVRRRLGRVGYRLDRVVVDEVDRVGAPIVGPPRPPAAVLAA